MKVNNAISGAIFLLIAIFAFVHAGNFQTMPGVPYGPGLFPRIVSVAMGLGSLLLMVSGLRQVSRTGWIQVADWARDPRSYILFFSVIGVVFVYLLLAETLGFLATSITVLILLLSASRGLFCWRSNVIIALIFSALIFALFGMLLRVPLPHGPIEALILGYS